MSLKVVIIGGVAGGMSAATRARRLNEDASIIVLEKGGFISFANCGLPYFLSGTIESDRKLLITTPERVRERYNIDARVKQEAIRIDRANREVEVKDHQTGAVYRLPYDKLILAPGASAVVPAMANVEAPNVFLLRSMEDTLRLDEWMRRRQPKSVAIVGAGFIGLEMAEAMRHRGMRVTLIEKVNHVLPPLDMDVTPWIAEELKRNEVDVHVGVGLKALRAEGGLVKEVELEDGQRIAADLVLLSIGVRPNTRLASEAGLTIGASGAIAVDAYQRTNDPDIYAVGDASEVIHAVTGKPMRMPLAGPANRQGRLAGEHAATGSAAPSPGVLGTAIVQVFDLAVGMTGLGEESARRAGFDAASAHVSPNHHASYYPDAQTLHMKLIYDQPSGHVLGAQIVGKAGVDKRIDVIATAMTFGATVQQLANLDLAYAPQFGAAKDPVHMAAMVASNQRDGVMPATSIDDLGDAVKLDVRTANEFREGSLVGAINIPVDELRGRLSELDAARDTVVFCQVGLRGYTAQRILSQHGFNHVRNLKGGFALASRLGNS